MPQNRPISYLYKGIATGVATLGIAIFFYGYVNDIFTPMLIGIAVALGSGVIGQRGQRHGLRDADELLANDKRLPILYLRSFGDEAQENRFINGLTAMFNRSIGGATIGWGRHEQETLAGYLGRFGPYITVGRPGDPLPDVGAAWKWVPDKKWKSEVGKLMKRSRLIVIHAGSSDGLHWEFQHLVKNIDAKKILLIVPRKKQDFLEFRGWATGILPKPLPTKMPASLLIIFDNAWQPQSLKSSIDFFEMLAPFFKQNNINSPSNVIQAQIHDEKQRKIKKKWNA